MGKLEGIVEQAYGVFSYYSVDQSLNVCTRKCCLSTDEELKLVSLPLKNIDSALLYSWNHAAKTDSPDLNEFKYYLPRILELISKYDFPAHSTALSLKSFQYYPKSDWSKEEQQVLTHFMDAYFEQSLNVYPLPNFTAIEDILVMTDMAGFDVSASLALWENSKYNGSVFHLASLVEFGVRLGQEESYRNEFASKEFTAKFSNWLNNEELQLGFMEKIEALILTDKTIDEETQYVLNRSYEILSLATTK